MSSFTIFGTKFNLNNDVIWWIAMILFVIQVLRFSSHMLKKIWAPKPLTAAFCVTVRSPAFVAILMGTGAFFIFSTRSES